MLSFNAAPLMHRCDVCRVTNVSVCRCIAQILAERVWKQQQQRRQEPQQDAFDALGGARS